MIAVSSIPGEQEPIRISLDETGFPVVAAGEPIHFEDTGQTLTSSETGSEQPHQEDASPIPVLGILAALSVSMYALKRANYRPPNWLGRSPSAPDHE